MISIGITGSFSVGKSLILNILNQKGYKIFNADEVVRQFYQNENIKQQIRLFHHDLLNFSIRSIANLLFVDVSFRKKITNLVHPYVAEKLRIFKEQSYAQQLIFCEIPLLFEAGFAEHFDCVVTVYCLEKTRQRRAKNKQNFSFKKFRQIKNQQLSQLEKIRRAHFTINTDIDLSKLPAKIDQLIQKIKDRF